MPNKNFTPGPYDPVAPGSPPSGGGGGGGAALFNGCLIVVAGMLLFIAVFAYLIWPDFAAFGARLDLVKFKEAVDSSDLPPPTKVALIDDLEAVRLSLDDRNQFNFFQWVNVEKEFLRILGDRRIDETELAKLKVEIGRIKKIQGLDPKR